MNTEKQTTQTKDSVTTCFNSISEIIINPYFINFVEGNISNLRLDRIKRPKPKPGFYYKRDWYDRMTSEGILNTKFFIANIENIWLKKSSLSSQIRNVIQFICNKSLEQTLSVYSNKTAL